jgi:hypothetical protein
VTTLTPRRTLTPRQGADLRRLIDHFGDLPLSAAGHVAEEYDRQDSRRLDEAEARAWLAAKAAGTNATAQSWQTLAREAVHSSARLYDDDEQTQPWALAGLAVQDAVLALVATGADERDRSRLLAAVQAGGFQIEVPQ